MSDPRLPADCLHRLIILAAAILTAGGAPLSAQVVTPAAPQAMVLRVYAADKRHPSLAGSYLAPLSSI